MSTPVSNAPTSPATEAPLLDRLVAARSMVGISLLGLAILSALIPIGFWLRSGGAYPDVIAWGSTLTILCLIGGALCLKGPVSEPSAPGHPGFFHILFLVLIGIAGLATTALGVSLTFHSQFNSNIAGGITEWRKNPLPVTWVGLALLGGLTMMFAGLLMARGYERTESALRRLLYGYNAILGSILLALILLLVNVLAYVGPWPFDFFRKTQDWTYSRKYTLAQATRNYLEQLKEPVQVYVLLNQRDPRNQRLNQEMENLLENCLNYTRQITWQFYSRDGNRKELTDLREKYGIPESFGVLVVYGSEKDRTSEFVKYEDLFKASRTQDEFGEGTNFVGEHALLQVMRQLADGKGKAKIAFSQGHGELELEKTDAQFPHSMGRVVSTLRNQGNYEVLTIPFGTLPREEIQKRLDEAEVVVIAGPTRPFKPEEVDLLRNFTRRPGPRPGRLMIMLDVYPPQGPMMQTGLESLLAEYQIRVNDDRIVAIDPDWPDEKAPNPTVMVSLVNPGTTQKVFRSAYVDNRRQPQSFWFIDLRSIEILPPPPGMPPRFSVEPLLIVPPQILVYSEKRLDLDPRKAAAALRDNEEMLQKNLAQTFLNAAVTVTESQGPPMPGRPPQESQPRLVVFGNANWLSNQEMLTSRFEGPFAQGQFNETKYQLFRGCLSWLRGRFDIGEEPEATPQPTFKLDRISSFGDIYNLLLLPPALMLLGVFCLGMGVWVIRRR